MDDILLRVFCTNGARGFKPDILVYADDILKIFCCVKVKLSCDLVVLANIHVILNTVDSFNGELCITKLMSY